MIISNGMDEPNQSSKEAQYTELLNPVKDLDKAFDIDIRTSLTDYLHYVREHAREANFNSAGLLVNGSTHVYGKKVDLLHKMTYDLYDTIMNISKPEQSAGKDASKTKDKNVDNDKGKQKLKSSRRKDLFISTEIKVSDSLSCLGKNSNSPKEPKQLYYVQPPPHLLPLAEEEMGEQFVDTRGNQIDRNGAYALNRCTLTSSGWLVLPTVSMAVVKSLETSEEDENEEIPQEFSYFSDDTDVEMGACAAVNASFSQDSACFDASPDAHSECIFPTPSPDDSPSQEAAQCPRPSPDEGFVSNPCSQTGPSDQELRETIRTIIKERQSAKKKSNAASEEEIEPPKKGGVQKKNTRCRPSRRRGASSLCSVSEFCSQTFFDDKSELDIVAFAHNSTFKKGLIERTGFLKSELHKLKITGEEEEEIDEEMEQMKDADLDDPAHVIEEADIEIHHVNIGTDLMPELDEDDSPAEAAAARYMLVSPVRHSTTPGVDTSPEDIIEDCMADIRKYVHTSDVAERVRAWEEEVKPYLEEIEKRGPFNIDEYGARLLDAFEDNNAKQTIVFREFCAQKKKWEIIRYFMALLPLINNGNVSIETEPYTEDCDEIYITLQSRKMHHKELENFGHNDGSSP